ncbi:hypothetical protein HD554DRAFT_2124595 [Boletus coccyginus]|nr:hypothetical protein HD554DRAFT_2124595 [Boletus coccyginus]
MSPNDDNAHDIESDFGIELPDDQPDEFSKLSPDSPTYPWPTREHFLASLLFSSPRLPFSRLQKRAVLDWARELGARNVPSLYSLQRCDEEVRKMVGDPTDKVISPLGNIFYINDIAKAIAKDYASPLTRLAMQDFPEDGGKGMSQVFNGEKMLLEAPSPPAARVDGNIYFIGELLQESSGRFFIPERFFLSGPLGTSTVIPESSGEQTLTGMKELFALGRSAVRTNAGFIISDEREIIPTSMFNRPYDEFHPSELACGLTESSKKHASLEPNPWRKKSGGRMVYAVPLIIFMDDVSGNISKQWNKHFVIYMSNANLPREMLEREFFVRFVASSPHASPMELMYAMKQSISKASTSGIVAWDCRDQEEVMLAPYGLFLAGDNPMQAEECSQAGLGSNHYCRTCLVGGTKEYKGSDIGYCSLFKPGIPRTPDGTRQTIKNQFENASLSGAATKIQASVSSTGVRDSLSLGILNTVVEMGKRLRKRGSGNAAMQEHEVKATLEKELDELLGGRGLEDMINPLLGMDGMNIHMDTPTEILHTILLGVVKYFWAQTIHLIEKAKLLNLFQSRLDSVERDALNAPSLSADYVCHYRGALIGKHFKSLAQVMPFIIYDMVPQTVIDGWTTIGELVVLVWHTRIEDLEVYLAQLSRTIEDFLNVTAMCAPSILITKPKFHFLVHLPAYIRRFGPALIFSTERYESFNHVFRLTCIHSSHQGPSHDTCRTFAWFDILKHIITGGFWYEKDLQKWTRAGPFVLNFLSDHPAQARLLGIKFDELKDEPMGVAGTGRVIRVASAVRSQDSRGSSRLSEAIPWRNTECAKIGTVPPMPAYHSDRKYFRGNVLMAKHGDKVKLMGHVIFAHASSNSEFSIGRVLEILIDDAHHRVVTHVAIQLFEFEPTLHPSLHVPRLRLTDHKVVVPCSDIVCAVNLQHNCTDSKCIALSHRTIQQERVSTTRTKAVIRHEDTPDHFLNTFSIHNHVFIRAALPALLRKTPLRVAAQDVEKVRSLATQQIRQKKAQRASSPVPGAANMGLDDATLAPPVFDQPSRQKQRQKQTNTTAAARQSNLRVASAQSSSTPIQTNASSGRTPRLITSTTSSSMARAPSAAPRVPVPHPHATLVAQSISSPLSGPAPLSTTPTASSALARTPSTLSSIPLPQLHPALVTQSIMSSSSGPIPLPIASTTSYLTRPPSEMSSVLLPHPHPTTATQLSSVHYYPYPTIVPLPESPAPTATTAMTRQFNLAVPSQLHTAPLVPYSAPATHYQPGPTQGHFGYHMQSYTAGQQRGAHFTAPSMPQIYYNSRPVPQCNTYYPSL